ncbi:hypothetical protein AQI95_29120 [Streptomyces yokosukanensis]|uniref:Uncharacterized protein n=1 Tax=Streptomyces yokosukanensis TaxID=67386 RepID=A0A101NZG1_9ACTN|nr:hypothetical protein [Streptomyces yokosukanensis]KUN02134.1 hypothetical protein AQI95_29120 [Streptomyces yokosukanensis]
MSPDPAPTAVRRAVSPLDERLEAVTGRDVDALWAHRDRGILDEPYTRLVDLHRELVQAETAVTFYRTHLHRLSSGEFPVDGAWFARVGRIVDQLEEAAGEREAAARRVLAILELVEAAARTAPPAGGEAISAADQAALLAIAGGAKLYQNLLTGRLSVTAASGTRIPHAELQRLEGAGLVAVDTSHSAQAGQPVTLTEAGRAALTTARPRKPAGAAKPAPRPGAWPSPSAHRR